MPLLGGVLCKLAICTYSHLCPEDRSQPPHSHIIITNTKGLVKVAILTNILFTKECQCVLDKSNCTYITVITVLQETYYIKHSNMANKKQSPFLSIEFLNSFTILIRYSSQVAYYHIKVYASLSNKK